MQRFREADRRVCCPEISKRLWTKFWHVWRTRRGFAERTTGVRSKGLRAATANGKTLINAASFWQRLRPAKSTLVDYRKKKNPVSMRIRQALSEGIVLHRAWQRINVSCFQMPSQTWACLVPSSLRQTHGMRWPLIQTCRDHCRRPVSSELRWRCWRGDMLQLVPFGDRRVLKLFEALENPGTLPMRNHEAVPTTRHNHTPRTGTQVDDVAGPTLLKKKSTVWTSDAVRLELLRRLVTQVRLVVLLFANHCQHLSS